MKLKINKSARNTFYGILFALITSLLITSLYASIVHRPKEENLTLPPFDWSFDTGLKLSLQLENRSNDLYRVSVSTSKIIAIANTSSSSDDNDSYGYISEPYSFFVYNTTYLNSYLNLESDNWILRLDRNNNEYPAIFLIEPESLNNLHSSLAESISSIDDFVNITENVQTEIKNAITPGMIEIRILHWYKDGSIVSINMLNNTLFIRYERFYHYESAYDYVGVKIDHQYPEQWYKGIVKEEFSAYYSSINELITNLYNI